MSYYDDDIDDEELDDEVDDGDSYLRDKAEEKIK